MNRPPNTEPILAEYRALTPRPNVVVEGVLFSDVHADWVDGHFLMHTRFCVGAKDIRVALNYDPASRTTAVPATTDISSAFGRALRLLSELRVVVEFEALTSGISLSGDWFDVDGDPPF